METIAKQRTHVSYSNEPMTAPKNGTAGVIQVVPLSEIRRFDRKMKYTVLRTIYFTVAFETVPYKEQHDQYDFTHVIQGVKSYLKHALEGEGKIADNEGLVMTDASIANVWNTYVEASKENKPK